MSWGEEAEALGLLSYRSSGATPPALSLHLSLPLSVVGRVVPVCHRNCRCCLLLFSSVVATFIPSCLIVNYCSWEWIARVLLGGAGIVGLGWEA